MRLLLLTAALLAPAQVAPPASPSEQRAVRGTLERLARDIVVFGPGQFLYGFRDTGFPPDAAQPIAAFSRFVEGRAWQAGDFTPLLKHDDARVRALAIIALYSIEQPQVLSAIYPLVDDTALTFPDVIPTARAYPTNRTIDPATLRKQTVGDLATAVVKFYMETGGYYYGPKGARTEPGFKEYW
jgi:hypothetical protein